MRSLGTYTVTVFLFSLPYSLFPLYNICNYLLHPRSNTAGFSCSTLGHISSDNVKIPAYFYKTISPRLHVASNPSNCLEIPPWSHIGTYFGSLSLCYSPAEYYYQGLLDDFWRSFLIQKSKIGLLRRIISYIAIFEFRFHGCSTILFLLLTCCWPGNGYHWDNLDDLRHSLIEKDYHWGLLFIKISVLHWYESHLDLNLGSKLSL